ncbi:MAG: hypothetical protein NTX56_19790 [Proteobacteria bacterium]|nr:hypothetical protein [Pseudomonadota bacterium]
MRESIVRGLMAVKAKAVQYYEKSKEVVTGFVAGTATLLGLSAPKESYAAGPDLTTVTAAVDFGTVTTAVLGVAAALIVVYIAWKGAKMVIAAVRGG